MNCLHPGDRHITDEAVELCGFKRYDRILDIGCGEGSTMEYLINSYGLDVIGCDTSPEMIKRAKTRNPDLRAVICDGHSICFPPSYFDGAYMECSFSLMSDHIIILQELFNTLKPGARLAVSDLYNTDNGISQNHRDNGRRISETADTSECIFNGIFIKDRLVKCLELAGFKLIAWIDKTRELRDYIAQVLMDYGSFDNMWKAKLPEGADIKCFCNVSYTRSTGYFLLAAERI